jgi:hypothetical protein
VDEPIEDTPSVNVTLPVGVPADAVMVAVNVTDCPYVDEFSEDDSTELVEAVVADTSTAADIASR